MSVRERLGLLLAVALCLPAVGFGAAAAATTSATCKTLSGIAVLAPGLPPAGSTALVKPTMSVNGAKVGGCIGPVTSGRASARLNFAKKYNCASFIADIADDVSVTAKGTVRVVWNNKTTSVITLSVSFGSVPARPSLATVVGTVTMGVFVGQRESWTILWAMKTTECFGGAPLTTLTFSQFAPITT
jgi:hypothetical protein